MIEKCMYIIMCLRYLMIFYNINYIYMKFIFKYFRRVINRGRVVRFEVFVVVVCIYFGEV